MKSQVGTKANLNILGHAYRNLSFLGGEGGGGGVSNIYKESACTGLIIFKYATSGTVIFSQIS